MQASIWIRWLRWLLQKQLTKKPVVVLNMDETTVHSSCDKRRGLHVGLSKRFAHVRRPFRRLGSRRCSLIAVICNSPELQQVLPQVILPRQRLKQQPRQAMKRMYAEMGAPIEAWHGSSGFADSNVLKMWLRTMAKCIRSKLGDVHILLTMDSAPAHLSQEVLQLAKKLDMHVALIPARCTWFLQMLDVKVFQHFKRTLRRNVMAAEDVEQSDVLRWPTYVRAVAEAIHRHLVQADWSAALAAMSMGSLPGPADPTLASLIACENLQPRPPTTAEFLGMAGRTHQKSTIPWSRLLRLDESAEQEFNEDPKALCSEVPPDECQTLPVAGAPRQCTSSSGSTSSGVFRPTEHLPSNIVRLSARNRLTPALNHRVKVEPPDRVGPAVSTRRQARTPDSDVQKSFAKSEI